MTLGTIPVSWPEEFGTLYRVQCDCGTSATSTKDETASDFCDRLFDEGWRWTDVDGPLCDTCVWEAG